MAAVAQQVPGHHLWVVGHGGGVETDGGRHVRGAQRATAPSSTVRAPTASARPPRRLGRADPAQRPPQRSPLPSVAQHTATQPSFAR